MDEDVKVGFGPDAEVEVVAVAGKLFLFVNGTCDQQEAYERALAQVNQSPPLRTGLLELPHPPLPPQGDGGPWDEVFARMWHSGGFEDSDIALLRAGIYELEWLREAESRERCVDAAYRMGGKPDHIARLESEERTTRANAAAWRAWGDEHAK